MPSPARLYAPLLAAVLLAGCASRTEWTRSADPGDPQLKRDEYECRRDAMMAAPTPAYPPAPGAAGGVAYGLRIGQQRRLFEECMASKGYQKP